MLLERVVLHVLSLVTTTDATQTCYMYWLCSPNMSRFMYFRKRSERRNGNILVLLLLPKYETDELSVFQKNNYPFKNFDKLISTPQDHEWWCNVPSVKRSNVSKDTTFPILLQFSFNTVDIYTVWMLNSEHKTEACVLISVPYHHTRRYNVRKRGGGSGYRVFTFHIVNLILYYWLKQWLIWGAMVSDHGI